MLGLVDVQELAPVSICYGRRPAEAALLIALAGGRRATVGGRSILAVGIVERPFGAPDDVPRERLRWIAAHRVERGLVQCESARRFEESERAFDFPDQIGGLTCSGGKGGE